MLSIGNDCVYYVVSGERSFLGKCFVDFVWFVFVVDE